jgi:anti-sigma factor RsiW
MKCREVVELMTEYLEGTLSVADTARFEEHMRGCDGCTAYLEQMRRTRTLTRRLADEPIPAALQEELVAAFKNWRAGPGSA